MKIGIEFKNLQNLTADKLYVEYCFNRICCYLLNTLYDMEIKPIYDPVVKKNLEWINSQETIENLIIIPRFTAETDEKNFEYIKRNINNDLGSHTLEELMVYEIKEEI